MPLKVSDGIGAWIDDFKKSDAPQFKGKSEKERRDQAIAAYLSAKKGPKNENVKSADKKPEMYTKPDGKRGVRMVAVDKEVVTKEAAARGKANPKVVNNIVNRFKKANPKPGDHHYHLDNISDDEQAHRGEKDQARQQLKKSGHFKEDSDAVKAFLAKGGKIKKLPPGKAAGYHGKDDPGKDVKGVMSKPDTDRFTTRKKVKSMGEKHMVSDPKLKNLKLPNPKDPTPYQKAKSIMKNRQTNEVSADKLSSYIQKASDATKHRGMATRKVDNRYSGVAKAQDKLAKSGMMGTTAQKVSKAKVGASRSMKEDTNFEVNIEGLPMMFMSGMSPGEIKAKLRGIVKQPSMINSVKRVTDATVRKTFRLKAQGKDEEEDA